MGMRLAGGWPQAPCFAPQLGDPHPCHPPFCGCPVLGGSIGGVSRSGLGTLGCAGSAAAPCREQSSLLSTDIAVRCWGMKGIAAERAALSPGAGQAAAPSVTSSRRPLPTVTSPAPVTKGHASPQLDPT